ncbi:23S rRNA (adenine(2503)-C(2))-methyltransferase RlmN [Breznakiella homolactica]|uniref:Probable dual-specificity RNA methyltransferase RlmN n=1 Tax=Breznakiella homolactica TaxID=2798577 RepID=A0A7T7XKH1_9SPIR|nr:23S rRNA (adenine(2503)-C(2))-methyltransferase RlmN [Breznakiella homolactica]QQO08069.1 23S rRNA (adenine(2503)-C(2))-methyltransferase RlmN [Breznakiella homolactica]
MDSAGGFTGFFPEELHEKLISYPQYRARQIFRWIARGAVSFDEMTDLPLSLRDDLKNRFSLYSTSVAARLEDPDGTVKLQIHLSDGAMVESVLLVDGEGRKTACLSVQVGCAMGCVFCKTGTLGLLRNLTASEIVEQFLHLRNLYPGISNIVVMGMGEPLHNIEALRRAVGIIEHTDGIGLSKRRITVSTSGIIKGIRDLADQGPDVRLAVSVTAADSELRDKLMPISRTNPLPGLKDALRYYQEKRPGRITLEAVLLGGLNTRPEDARALVSFAQGLDVIVNLIPWNPVEGTALDGIPLREPGTREADGFARYLENASVRVTRRYGKGRSVAGACGQLGRAPAE